MWQDAVFVVWLKKSTTEETLTGKMLCKQIPGHNMVQVLRRSSWIRRDIKVVNHESRSNSLTKVEQGRESMARSE